MMNGVIDTATGDLLRKGFCDFENDGSFDGAKETHKTDVPEDAKVKATNAGDFTKFDGNDYVIVVRSTFTDKGRENILHEVLKDKEGDPPTLARLLDALDIHSSVLAALDNHNYTLASSRLQKAVDDLDITTDDKTDIEAFFPAGWNS